MTLPPGSYHVLSVWQPWAWCLFHGKGIENRPWATNYRGPLLIHAAKNRAALDLIPDIETRFQLKIPLPDLAFGALIGWTEIHDCHHSQVASSCGWGMPGGFHWHVRGQQLLDQPIPCRGYQRIFNVTLPLPPEQTLL